MNNIPHARFNFDNRGTRYSNAENIVIEKEIIETTSCYWLHKKEVMPGSRLLIYLHGGCFVLGSIQSHQALVSHLSSELDIPVLFIEYGLAPENPFPAAIEDILKVYRHLLTRKQIKDILIMGDSAGGGLAVSVISRINKENINKPGRLLMLSPWVDLRCNSNSILANAAMDPTLTKEQLQAFTSMYIGHNKLSNANPIETIVGEFPPTLILVGSREILSDDSNLVFARIAEKQPDVKLSRYENQTHVWLFDDIHAEDSIKAIKEIKDFIGSPHP